MYVKIQSICKFAYKREKHNQNSNDEFSIQFNRTNAKILFFDFFYLKKNSNGFKFQHFLAKGLF